MEQIIEVVGNQAVQNISPDIFDAIEKLQKGGFISLPNYATSKGEVANYVINGAINYGKIKVLQNEKLHGCTEEILVAVSAESNIPLDIVKNALAELIIASDKNLSEDKEDRTAQSQAQNEAYINFGKGLKMHVVTENFHIDGLVVSKTNVRNRQPYDEPKKAITKAKRAIEKALNFNSVKYGSFIVGRSEFINLSGMTVNTQE